MDVPKRPGPAVARAVVADGSARQTRFRAARARLAAATDAGRTRAETTPDGGSTSFVTPTCPPSPRSPRAGIRCARTPARCARLLPMSWEPAESSRGDDPKTRPAPSYRPRHSPLTRARRLACLPRVSAQVECISVVTFGVLSRPAAACTPPAAAPLHVLARLPAAARLLRYGDYFQEWCGSCGADSAVSDAGGFV